MSKSDSLRMRDVRDACRLIGDCRDVGKHILVSWYRRMLEGLYVLFGVIQAAGGEALWDRPGHTITPVSGYSVSGEARPGTTHLATTVAPRGRESDPIYQAIQKLPGKLITRTRRQLVSDAAWYRSASF